MAIIAGIAAAAIAAGATVYASSQQSAAARSAARTQRRGAQDAAAVEAEIAERNLAQQREFYYDQQRRLQPYLQAGYTALPYLQSLTLAGSPLPGASGGTAVPGVSPALTASYEQLADAAIRTPAAQGGGLPVGRVDPQTGQFVPFTADETRTALEAQRQNLAGQAPLAQPALTGPVVRETGEAPQFTLAQPAPFQFSLADFEADPGYQFRVQQGQQAIERSAAARGGATGGAVLKDLTRFGQDVGSQEYQAAYNRALGRYDLNTLQPYERERQRFVLNVNTRNEERDRQFNRLAALAGIGQTATSRLADVGGQTTSLASQALANLGQSQAAGITGAANVQAAGYLGRANALTQGVTGVANIGVQALNAYQLQQQYQQQQAQQDLLRRQLFAASTPQYAGVTGANPYQTSIYNPYS